MGKKSILDFKKKRISWNNTIFSKEPAYRGGLEYVNCIPCSGVRTPPPKKKKCLGYDIRSGNVEYLFIAWFTQVQRVLSIGKIDLFKDIPIRKEYFMPYNCKLFVLKSYLKL